MIVAARRLVVFEFEHDVARAGRAFQRLPAAAARERHEADRAVGIVGELASLLRDLRRVEMRTLPPSPTLAARSAAGELEARLAALAELDALDVEKKLKLFG